MDAKVVDDYFYKNAGPVWGELRCGLWHRTGSHLFRSILESGEIRSNPDLPPGEFKWAMSGTTYARDVGGVSLFDFENADWNWIFENGQQHYWVPFLKAPCDSAPLEKWVATVWLAVDRHQLPDFVSLKEVGIDWVKNGSRKWMPRIEACHKGAIPLSACLRALVVCAVRPEKFLSMNLNPFNLAELERVEADWRKLFSDDYDTRALPMSERMRRIHLPERHLTTEETSDFSARIAAARKRAGLS